MKKISDSDIRSDDTEAGKKIFIRFLTAVLIWTIMVIVHVFMKNNLVCGLVWITGLLFLWLSYSRHRRVLSEKQRVRQKLSESEEKYRQIFTNIFDCVMITNPTGEITDFNTACLKLFGFENKGQAERSLMYQLYEHPEERSQILQKIEENGFISEYPVRMKRRDGSVMDTLLTSVLIKKQDSSEKQYLSIFRDITEKKRLETDLRESEKKFRLAFETAQDAIVWANAETGILIECNDAALSLFEKSKSDLIGTHQTTLHPSEKAEYYQALFREQLRWARTGIEAEIITKTGEIRFVSINVSLTEVGGQKVVQGIFRDMTERRQMEHALRESEERFRLFMDNSPILAWLKDENGCYAYINKFYENRFNLTPEDWNGKTDFDLWQSHIAEVFRKNDLTVLSTGESAEFQEKTGTPENGVWLTYKFLFSDAQGRKFVGGIGADITERVHNEELRVANAALEKTARLKDEFLAMMSHELRTPLTGVLSLSEALLDEVYGPLSEKQQKTVRCIESSGQHLLELITDILDLSKIEAGQMKLQIHPSSVSDICQSTLGMIKSMADKKQHHLSFDMRPPDINLNADPRRLKQMLMNLLSNAVKFTPDGGQIMLEVRGDEAEQLIHFHVSDTGIGIAPEKSGSLFRPFVQLDSRLSRQYSGTGLGLSLVRRMAELHGGTVSFESEPGKGSRFTISLPWLKFEGAEYSVS